MPIFGWQPLIVCDGVATHCGFYEFVTLIKNGVTDLILLSTLFALAVMIYAAILWLSSGGDSGAHKKALGMFGNVVKGYVWILAAWVIVYTIMSTLLKPEFNLFLKG
jgi:hypothetical protein